MWYNSKYEDAKIKRKKRRSIHDHRPLCVHTQLCGIGKPLRIGEKENTVEGK